MAVTTAADDAKPNTAGGRSTGDVLRELATALGALAAVIYVTGGIALGIRLGLSDLPSSVAVPQLPREFLISLGLVIVLPALGVGLAAWWVLRRLASDSGPAWWRGATSTSVAGRLRRLRPRSTGIVLGLAVYLTIGVLVIAKDPFPAWVCLSDGGVVRGVFIGEANGRTYLGDRPGLSPRRVIAIDQSRIAAVFVGGHDLRGLSCRSAVHRAV